VTQVIPQGVASSYPMNKDPKVSFFSQVALSMYRQMLVCLRNRSALGIYFILQLSGAAFLSVAFSIIIQASWKGTLVIPPPSNIIDYVPSPVISPKGNPNDLGFKQLLFFFPAILGTMSSLCAVPLFSGKMRLIRREAQTGISPIACGIGFLLFDLIVVLWSSLCFGAAWVLFGHPGGWSNWLAVVFFTSFAASGMGYISGVFASPTSANTIAVVMSMICAVFSGVEPKLKQVNDMAILAAPWYLSYATWSAETVYYTWTRYLTQGGVNNEEEIDQGADLFGYQVSDNSRGVGCLVALGISFRLIALFSLRYKAWSSD
jgi:hypothetical protein